ncbi:MAG TPA: hypothetical protein VN328_00105 [Thermodesulfovibrionales bacterium]|nr:hypothetical protein [Thermodesulfovibrionales bacterium]
MDRLDRISIWVIVLLIVSSFALISRHMGEARPDRSLQQRRAADYSTVNAEVDNRVKQIKNVIEAGSLNKAEIMIRELMQKYPYEGGPRMLMGDILMRRQEPVKAMFEYKEGIDLNPDYLDKKTPLFQGKKLKIVVGEALTEIEKKIKLSPGDESLRSDRKTIYYLQRKIAGSCS